MLTDKQKEQVKEEWLHRGGPFASHTIARRLGLTHEYVWNYLLELELNNRQ